MHEQYNKERFYIERVKKYAFDTLLYNNTVNSTYHAINNNFYDSFFFHPKTEFHQSSFPIYKQSVVILVVVALSAVSYT